MFTIGEVARQAGLNASALRYYEQAGLIPSPARNNGQRRYSNQIIGRLEVIRLAQSAGFHIEEIKALLEGFDSNVPPSERWHAMAAKKHEELNQKIKQMQTMQAILEKSLRCSCLSWEECFANIQLCP